MENFIPYGKRSQKGSNTTATRKTVNSMAYKRTKARDWKHE